MTYVRARTRIEVTSPVVMVIPEIISTDRIRRIIITIFLTEEITEGTITTLPEE